MSFSPAVPVGSAELAKTDDDQGGARHRDLLPSRRAACRMVLRGRHGSTLRMRHGPTCGLSRSERPHPGGGPRCPRTQTVSVSPALARGARRDQVRPHAHVRQCAAAHPPASRAGHPPTRPAARENPRRGGAADGAYARARRQSRICQAERQFWPDYATPRSCPDLRRQHRARFPRQARRAPA